jgi:hypothetical protein
MKYLFIKLEQKLQGTSATGMKIKLQLYRINNTSPFLAAPPSSEFSVIT